MTYSAVRVEKLSKSFHINPTLQRQDTLRDTLVELFAGLARRRSNGGRGSAATFWALREVSFDVKEGEVMGVIGRNGAGKSTLLKILSKIMEPTQGRAFIRGRVGSLLEVATGFHPELSGRENVYLNGAILGMQRAEINRKFDEIVAFAEIERFLETPVKRYSSGMYVRLAFAVAAHLEPEILLVDEVLAVGDAAFQKKCIGKMGDVAKEGRTVLFVSHNMSAVQRLCGRALLLDGGQIAALGETSEVVSRYLALFSFIAPPAEWVDLGFVPRQGTGKARFTGIWYSSGNAAVMNRASTNGPLELVVGIQAESARAVSSLAMTFYDEYGTKLVNADTVSIDQTLQLEPGMNYIRFRIDKLYLAPGTYTLGLWAANPPAEVYDWMKTGINIEVFDPGVKDGSGIRADGVVICQFEVFKDVQPPI